MYIYLDKQGVVREIVNDEAIRQMSSNANEINVYFDGLDDYDIKDVLATWQLPDGTITDEMEVATATEEKEIPYDAERDLKCFEYYKVYPFYSFAIIDEALSQDGVVRLTLRFAQKNGEYIKVAGLICFDVEASVVKEDTDISLAQYNYLIKVWAQTKDFLPLDGSIPMQGDLQTGKHSVLLNGKTLKDKNGALNYNGKDLAKREDVSSLQSQIDTINATQNVVDIVGTKAELNAYETKDLHANDKIEVLTDESQNNANTIYEWNGNAWSLVGSKAPYYSKSESDARYDELKAKSYDKDATLDDLTQGHVPDSNVVKGISVDVKAQKQMLDAIGDEVFKSVKKDTDASLKSLTLPSAKDLKTKDGTGFGGEDVLDWSSKTITDEGVTLTATEIEELKKHAKLKVNIAGLLVFVIDYAIAEEDNSMLVTVPYTAQTGFGISGFVIKLENNVMSYSIISVPLGIQVNGNRLELADATEYNPYVNTINGTQVLATDKVHDIKVQVPLYHHTITLHNATNKAYFTFSIDRTWQAGITKGTLFNVLNAYIAVGTGIVQNVLIDKISFRNTAEKTKVHQYASFGTSGYVNAEVTFASVFGTGYTLEDVTYPLA